MAQAIAAQLGFKSPALLTEALTHSSSGGASNNERLEFFGDAVLKLVVSEYLVNRYPQYTEGQLTQVRAWLISDKALAIIAKSMQLWDQLIVSKSTRAQGVKASILANAVEAIIGALYLDQGLPATTDFLIPYLDDTLIPLVDKNWHLDYKSTIQEYCQKAHQPLPVYTETGTTGNEHDKTFTITLRIRDTQGGVRETTGQGHSKKAAQQAAAKAMVEALGLL